MKKLSYIFFFTCLFEASVVFAQVHNFVNYSVEQGLEQADVPSIFQASNGYLLYGTNGGGLGYYDGYTFKAIKSKEGLADNVVFSITEVDNYIWCATNAGISKLSVSNFSVKKNYSLTRSFYTSFVGKNNTLYFGGANGLYYYDQKKDSVVKKEFNDSLLSNAVITAIYKDSEANLWVGTRENGLYKVTPNNEITNFSTSNSIFTQNNIRCIIETENKQLFVGTLDGLFVFKNDILQSLGINKDKSLLLTFTGLGIRSNKLVATALNGYLYFIDLTTYKIDALNEINGFLYKNAWALEIDKEQNVWIGTLGSGIIKYIPSFKYYNENNGLTNSYINAVNKVGDLLFVSNKKTLDIIENNKVIQTINFQNEKFSTIYFTCLVKDNIYLGTSDGVYLLKDKSFIKIPSNTTNLINEEIYTYYQHQNSFLFGGKSGVYELKNDSLLLLKDSPTTPVYNIVNYKNHFYFASEKGIYKQNTTNIEFISNDKGLNCTRARTFVVENEMLWIGTSNGVFLFDGKKVVGQISEKNKMLSDNAYFIIDDKKGNIWAGTNKGVDKINIESVYAHLSDNNLPIKITNYNKNKGFNGMECNMNAVSMYKNQLYFGTINGLYIYDSKEDRENELPPVLNLQNIKLNFENVQWKDFGTLTDSLSNLPLNLSLSHKNNNLLFEYVGISLTNPDEVAYQYKLEGLDNDWLPITTDRKAVYTAIPPGSYTFLLKAKNADGYWTTEPVSFSFTITPPWYKTNLFYGFCVVFILSTFYFTMDYRTKKLKKEQLLLTLKVDERTKELRNEKEKVETINAQLEEKNELIEVANKNITDSINYAKKIQEAILPKPSKIEELSKNVSVLFIPKDVVSGDFYWIERVGEKIIFSSADCTGHGVPGAFMSMIGINSLNQIVLENKITAPNLILQELNNKIKKALKQEDEDSQSRDGMDIVLVSFDNTTNIMSYAGAFRPLVYVRDNKLVELKGTRQPIGGNTSINATFDLTEIKTKSGDVFFLFSDGYADQFGGEKNKKMMNKKLKELFLTIHKETPEVQKEMLSAAFYKWKGNNEQVDDILVICIKV